MFKDLRKKYYEWQDKKEYEKHIPKEEKTAKSSTIDPGVKKALIFFILALVLIIVVIAVLFLIKSKSNKNNKVTETNEIVTPEESETTEVDTFDYISIDTTSENVTERYTYHEYSTISKVEETETETEELPVYVPAPVETQVPETELIVKEPQTSKKQQKTTHKSNKETTKAKVNNKVPAYKENNSAIGKSNMQLIRNTIMNSINGSYDTNMQNLAIYMAKNRLSNAQSTLEKLCNNTTLTVSAKTASVTVSSTSSEDMLEAAEKLADNLTLNAGKYGMGINAEFSGNNYKIYVVITILQGGN
jgi:hypothetical protein